MENATFLKTKTLLTSLPSDILLLHTRLCHQLLQERITFEQVINIELLEKTDWRLRMIEIKARLYDINEKLKELEAERQNLCKRDKRKGF